VPFSLIEDKRISARDILNAYERQRETGNDNAKSGATGPRPRQRNPSPDVRAVECKEQRSPLPGGTAWICFCPHQLLPLSRPRCHAIGKFGESPLKIAPPFRTLHERYPVEDLQEPLAEGIITGHPTMPEFRFDPGQVGDIIAYLKTLEH
jgi:hypothetical protein